MTTVPDARPFMRIDVRPERDWVRVAPMGELDLATVPELARTVGELRDAGFTAFRLDLRGLGFMDSSGLHYLLELSRDAAVRLQLTHAPRQVQRLFELAGVTELLPLPAKRPGGAAPVLRWVHEHA
jgi:anti-anti-sigma factor